MWNPATTPAGAVGKPVVTFDLDGAPEVIRDGVSGYLAPPIDIHAIASRTIELLRDPERRCAFADSGRDYARDHFSVEQMVDRINAVYIELLSQRGYLACAGSPGTDSDRIEVRAR